MSYTDEFQTVDLIIRSSAETRGVDAFALSLIKAERQMRKLVTYLVFQFPCFTDDDISRLREALGKNCNVYFEGFERGFDAIYMRSIQELVGSEYTRLRDRIKDAIYCRNKIFHGQLTKHNLGRKELLDFVADIRSWCESVARSTEAEVGYDGFARNSFQKAKIGDLSTRFKEQINSIDEYQHFISTHMQRKTRCPTGRREVSGSG